MRWTQQLLEALWESAPDGVVISAADGRIVLANARARQLFGYSAQALIGQSVDVLVPDETRPEHPRQREQFLASQKPRRRLLLRGRRRDGGVFPAEISLSAVDSEEGGTLVVAVIRDDTAHRETERAQALLASIVQSSHDAIVSTDLDGTILSWNPGAERLYGYTAEEMVGRPVDTLIPAERRVDEQEIRTIVTAGGRVDRFRTTRLHRDGGVVGVSLLVSPLTGRDGATLGVTTTARDISERERAEAQVQAVLDAAPDALLGVDDTGRIVLVNSQAERLFDFPRYDMMDMTVRRLLPAGLPRPPEELRDRGSETPLDTPLLTGVQGGDASGSWASFTARRRDGSELPVDISVSVLRMDTGLVVLAAVRDISDRLAAQAEQDRLREEAERQKLEVRLQRTQRLESLGQLAGGIAHDFNNLLAVIMNYAEFIAADGTDTPFAADAQQILRAAQRGGDLTHQLLAFARREVIRPRPLDVNAVVVEVRQMLARSIGEHITLSTRLARTLPAVMADPGQLEQVLVNLAVNARDAMPTGGRLTIDTAVVDVDAEHSAARAGLAPGRYVRLRVSDTGTGMPKEVVERAFDPFFTTKPNGEGTGLGLATVYGIVTQAGGSVHIYSEPGLGTTINVLLPATDQAVDTEPAERESRDRRGAGEVILLAEDEAALRTVTARILCRAGYRVLEAAHPAEALALAEAHAGHVDLLLTDVVMPGMLGTELAERVRAVRPETRVLFMSGYAQSLLTGHGTLDVGVHLVEKPFTGADLLAAVHQQLARGEG